MKIQSWELEQYRGAASEVVMQLNGSPYNRVQTLLGEMDEWQYQAIQMHELRLRYEAMKQFGLLP